MPNTAFSGQFVVDLDVVIAACRRLFPHSGRPPHGRRSPLLPRGSYPLQSAHSSKLAQRAHHMKHHACLAPLTEVQVVSHHYVEKIVGSQRAISGRLDMVAGDKELLAPVWRSEDRTVWIVCSIGKKLQ